MPVTRGHGLAVEAHEGCVGIFRRNALKGKADDAGRAVLQPHLTPPTSSLHGIPSTTPTVTVASTNASSP